MMVKAATDLLVHIFCGYVFISFEEMPKVRIPEPQDHCFFWLYFIRNRQTFSSTVAVLFTSPPVTYKSSSYSTETFGAIMEKKKKKAILIGGVC